MEDGLVKTLWIILWLSSMCLDGLWASLTVHIWPLQNYGHIITSRHETDIHHKIFDLLNVWKLHSWHPEINTIYHKPPMLYEKQWNSIKMTKNYFQLLTSAKSYYIGRETTDRPFTYQCHFLILLVEINFVIFWGKTLEFHRSTKNSCLLMPKDLMPILTRQWTKANAIHYIYMDFDKVTILIHRSCNGCTVCH